MYGEGLQDGVGFDCIFNLWMWLVLEVEARN